MKLISIAAILTAAMTINMQAQAAPVVYNNAIATGTAAFDATVASVGGTVTKDALKGLTSYASTWDRPGYTIDSTDGSNRYINPTYIPSGESITIDPYSPANGSGVTFTFDTGINAFGLEIGDWATCCYLPSSLYISFDGGATRLVASAKSSSDNPGYVATGSFLNFVGAIDTSNTFKTVTFYGDGFGEYLYAGGTIRYATLELGSVPETPVPEPDTYAMILAGLALVGFVARRRSKYVA